MIGSIVELNIDKVAWLIGNFKEKGVTDPRYIIMNRDTLDMLKISSRCMRRSSSSYETLYGFPIAVSEVLKFGEVDII